MSSKFGAYEILYELKSGGMGAVLLARRRGPGAFEQLVAIKTIRPEFAQAPAIRAMFLDEAAILARLNHPGIATVHDFGEEAGTLYMVMEYVAGQPLRDLATHVMPPVIVARALAEAARGLHAAHEARDPSGALMGLVHRDISPDNLMLGYDGHIKVIDFGIALVKNRQSPVTEFGTVKGKPPYMSPEQVANEPMDRRSDVWALGVVAWEMLAGRQLFDGDSIYAIAYAVGNQDIVVPSQARGDGLPIGLDAAVMGALLRDVNQRTSTAAAFAEQLEQVVQASGGETLAAWAERELVAERAQHRTWLAGIVTAQTPQLPRATSRPTDQATQVGPLAAVAVAETVHATPPQTSLGPDDEVAPPARSRTPLIILVLALLVAGVVVFLATRGGDEVKAKPPIDAAVPHTDAPLIVQPGPVDAMIAIDAQDIDAALPIDAGRTVIVTRHRDAGVVRQADAAVSVAVVGTGAVTIRATDGSNTVTIDDGGPLAPPINHKKLAAGRHVIKFYDGKSSALLDTQTVELADGQHVTVKQH